MAKLDIKNQAGEKVKSITLDKTVWAIEAHRPSLYDAIVKDRASLRQGTHKTKDRSEKRGGGAKPWRQKGTGRARAGSRRSPIWVGGGVTFGPTPRDYSKKQNRKERRLALRSALSNIYKEKAVVGLDTLAFKTYKTKDMITMMENLKVSGKVLFLTDELNEEAYYASRNLSNVRMITADSASVLDIVNADYLVITEPAIKMLEEVLSNAKA